MRKPPFAITFLLAFSSLVAQQSPYLEAAGQVRSWLLANAIQTDHGLAWAVEPDNPRAILTHLYSGTPGIALFFVEDYRVRGDEQSLKTAQGAADYLLALLPEDAADVRGRNGLYTGIAGIGFTLNEVYKAGGGAKYLHGARETVRLLQESALRSESGVEWSDVTDIIGGSAGTGLFLLYAAREMQLPEARELARQVGRRLIARAKSVKGGLMWSMNDTFPRIMPNFSHGTAGIAYFLATLHQETGDTEFLQAAIAGARHLQSIADVFEGGACLIFHHGPDGKELYYLSWCHGPAGTARLFYRLHQITRDPEWMDWVHRLAQGILSSGIPEKETPGYWNNVSQCCGAAGVAQFFLNLHRATGREDYRVFARRVADVLLDRGQVADGRLKWVQAEHRVRPELLAAQTGYMQGASGIGVLLLRMHEAESGQDPFVVLPDSPYASR